MADNTNVQAANPQEQEMAAALQQHQMQVLGKAAEKAGFNPDNPKHKAAFEAHIKELGTVTNEAQLAKLHEKVGMDFTGFQQQFNSALQTHQTQAQQGNAELGKLDQDFINLGQEVDGLNKTKGTRNIIAMVAAAVGAVGAVLGINRFVVSKQPTWGGFAKFATRAGSAIAGMAIFGKLTSYLAVKPVERKIEEAQDKISDTKQRATDIQTSLATNETKLVNEQELFEVEFHTRSLKARLAELDKAPHAAPHAKQERTEHTPHTPKHAPHAGGHASDHTPDRANTSSGPEVPPQPDMDAEIRKEREEGKNFAHKDERREAHPDVAGGTQQLGGSQDVVIEKKKEPWEATATNIAPKAAGFAARENAPADSHALAAEESKLAAANQQLAV